MAAETAEKMDTDSEVAAREARIKEATLRGEAPIKPEYLKPKPSVSSSSAPSMDATDETKGQKRAAEESVAEAEAADQQEEGGKGKGKGKDGGKGKGKKRQRGMNKNKDRAANSEAMKNVRASQICSRFAYMNHCPQQDSADGSKCKQPHDLDAFYEGKLPDIEQPCPVLARLGVCPAGLNCRYQGHVQDRKNVDKDGVVVTPESEWVKKIPNVGHPPGETNIFSFETVGKLRKKLFDFSKSTEVAKAWQKYCSGGSDTPLGAIVQPDIKPLDVKGKSILAPLTTVGNLPFRRLCVKLGCDVTVGEMALAGSILDGAAPELSLLRRHESEKCFGIQVAGGDVETMSKLAQFIDEHVDCDFVDINCGCPLDEVHRRGAGSRLMARTKAMEGIVRCMQTNLKTKPLTLKMRTADHEEKRHPEFGGRYAHKLVPQLEEWGVSAITLHGRTARQRYTKLADWDYTKECSSRRATNTPFIACGDVLSWEEAEEHKAQHGADAIMVGRGALMKPWLFTEMSEKRHWDISASERLDLIRDFTHYGLDHWGSDGRGVETTRRFLLEWLSFTCRYVPIGLLEQMPPKINWRPRPYVGRSDLETKLASPSAKDWVEITEMFLGKVPDGFTFIPKHKSNAYDAPTGGAQEEAQDVQG
eukprot:CAMPEP_0206420336 /NCGR_PEP_ID=MMETSP0324_2-20121206/770_1 /ASSEMBLY_ACC=CAM_ASM_000836 /TAXON_ID=2866 /ORGANISM="Crypthecodinium cohnii, Strain Seligo" /LENGTH=645 /DNA_ID=CAMNT_0053884177 /DNA_START=21 /DNA_END=1958 /DNA_ORIENTATION=+